MEINTPSFGPIASPHVQLSLREEGWGNWNPLN